jgi:hypothetical protein
LISAFENFGSVNSAVFSKQRHPVCNFVVKFIIPVNVKLPLKKTLPTDLYFSSLMSYCPETLLLVLWAFIHGFPS